MTRREVCVITIVLRAFLLGVLLFSSGDGVQKELVARHAKRFAVSAKPVTVTLDLTRAKQRFKAKDVVVLEVEGVDAAKPPGFIVSVIAGGREIGGIALYTFEEPQTFALDATRAVAEALKRDGRTLQVRFVPVLGVEGEPARPASPVRISRVSLSIERP
jgi:hypothetical protein